MNLKTSKNKIKKKNIMNKISVAIPTFYSSKFISQTIESLKNDSIINEIIICDDSENAIEFKALKNTVSKLLENTEIKLNITKNSKNLGGFKNKYKCIEKVSSEFVYQIDSDNIANTKSLRHISKLNLQALDKSILHLPSKIYLFNRNKNERFFKPSNNVIYFKEDKVVDSYQIKNALLSNKKFVISRNIGWLLNTGNPFVYKKSYLEYLKPGLSKSEDTLAACSIALFYYWLNSGNSISISKFLSHYHRLRDDSYFVSKGDIAIKSINHFKEQIKNLS